MYANSVWDLIVRSVALSVFQDVTSAGDRWQAFGTGRPTAPPGTTRPARLPDSGPSGVCLTLPGRRHRAR